jgi:N-acetyl sugar amidotransferase
MNKDLQICTRCIIDASVPNVSFNEAGICNFCSEFLESSSYLMNQKPEERQRALETLINKVKRNGRGGKYDCIVGVSGGVDSSWALVQIVKLGLRPLAVHMDNGWNSEASQNNIENLVKRLGVDLFTYVIDWDEYRNLLQAFLDADVIDVELLADNALVAVMYNQAAKYRLHYILTGYNQITEGFPMPAEWSWNKFDRRNIVAIGKRFGNIKLKTFPAIGTLRWAYYHYIRLIQLNPTLNYLEYNKPEAFEILQRDYGYKPYPYKHYESVLTRFYQGYILPAKFGVDKRKVHLSALVAAGQMTREEALNKLDGIAYSTEKELNDDKEYFIKKMGWSMAQLENYITRPEVKHTAYKSEKSLNEIVTRLPDLLPISLKHRITRLVKSAR